MTTHYNSHGQLVLAICGSEDLPHFKVTEVVMAAETLRQRIVTVLESNAEKKLTACQVAVMLKAKRSSVSSALSTLRGRGLVATHARAGARGGTGYTTTTLAVGLGKDLLPEQTREAADQAAHTAGAASDQRQATDPAAPADGADE